jgi:outer membrane protein assembly factor BamB
MNFDELVTINGVTLRATGSVYIGNGDDDDRDEMENLEIYVPDSDVNLYEVIGVLAEVEAEVWDKIKYP